MPGLWPRRSSPGRVEPSSCRHSLFTTTMSDALSFVQLVCCHPIRSFQSTDRETEVSTRPPTSRARARLQRSSLSYGTVCLQVYLGFETAHPYNLITLMIDRRAQCYTVGEWRFQLPFPRSFIISSVVLWKSGNISYQLLSI